MGQTGLETDWNAVPVHKIDQYHRSVSSIKRFLRLFCLLNAPILLLAFRFVKFPISSTESEGNVSHGYIVD